MAQLQVLNESQGDLHSLDSVALEDLLRLLVQRCHCEECEVRTMFANGRPANKVPGMISAIKLIPTLMVCD